MQGDMFSYLTRYFVDMNLDPNPFRVIWVFVSPDPPDSLPALTGGATT